MNKGKYNVAIIFLLIISGYLLTGCHFDPSGCGGSSEFEGCFVTGVAGESSGVKINLVSGPCELLHGTLIINLGFRSIGLEGKKKAEGFAELNGTDTSDPDTKIPINVFLVVGDENDRDDDTVTLQIKDEIPIGPMSRCEEDG